MTHLSENEAAAARGSAGADGSGDCDVLVVGGSAAGLAAALQIVRQLRSVTVVDGGEPRNAPAEHMHGYLGRDGEPPRGLVEQGRREVRSGAEVQSVELVDGSSIAADAVVVGPRFEAHLSPFAALGLSGEPHPSGLGDTLVVDPGTGETAVAGVFAAGNVTDPSQQVLHAAANGSRVGAMVSFSLAREELERAPEAAPL